MISSYLDYTELTKELLQINPEIPIILLIGYSELVDREKAKKIGIKKLIKKPILATDLSKVIRHVLDNHNGNYKNG